MESVGRVERPPRHCTAARDIGDHIEQYCQRRKWMLAAPTCDPRPDVPSQPFHVKLNDR